MCQKPAGGGLFVSKLTAWCCRFTSGKQRNDGCVQCASGSEKIDCSERSCRNGLLAALGLQCMGKACARQTEPSLLCVCAGPKTGRSLINGLKATGVCKAD